VYVRESRENIFPAQTVSLTVYACPFQDTVSCMTFIFFKGYNPAVMKLMAADLRTDREKMIFPIHSQSHIPVSLRSFFH